MNNQIIYIDQLMNRTMSKIADAAAKHDLTALKGLTSQASELKQIKEQLLAIQQRLRVLGNGDQGGAQAISQGGALLREIRIPVTQGMINQNLLTLTEAIKRGTVKVGEELTIEAAASGRRFRTVVMASGNKLQERGEISKFYSAANVADGNYVTLRETSPGQWKLSKAEGGCLDGARL